MSSCNDGFQEMQALQQQREEALQRAARIEAEIARRQHGADAVTGDDALVQRGLDDVVSKMDEQALQDWVSTAMETKTKTNISSGGAQPNNFVQLMRSADISTAQDYAKLSKALLDTGTKLNPESFRFVNETFGKEFVADQVMKAYGELVGTDKLALLLAQDVAPFMNLVERMTRLRVAASGFRKGFLEDIRAMKEFRAQSAEPVPSNLRSAAFDSYRKALLSERHVDLARSRTGQTLRSLRDDLPDLEALRTQLETGELFAPDPDMVKQELGARPGDTQVGELFTEIIEAVDDTNAARGAEKLNQLVLTIELEGTNPASRLRDHKWFNSQMKLGNLLAKDSQLTNFNTQVVANAGSNVAMALVGPYRQMFENVGALTPFGTRFSRDAWTNGFAASWQGTKQAMDVLRTSGKEVFMDAVVNGRSVFAGNKDTFGKTLQADDAMAAKLKDLMDMPFQKGWMLNPINLGLFRNKVHAAMRLFMYEKTGQGFFMEPGLRLMAGTDNVAGLYHHAFKVRNDLEIRARRDGVQLQLDQGQTVQDWIDQEFDRAFYSLEPTEADVKSYRRELGLTGEVSDDEIKLEILNKRIGETYGAPTLGTPESLAAEAYSRELRFQNEPGDFRAESTRGQLAGAAYGGVQQARGHWLVDLAFPYLQAPLMGALLDMNHLGITPAIDTVSMWMNPGGFTPAQRARVQANWVVAGTIWGSFFALDAGGLIVGSGPIDPKEKQEWRMDLERRGLVPNSIAGVPLLGGIPVINTLFLLKDIKENFITGSYSKYDQNQALMAGMQVLTGQLMRQTSFGQFNQIMEILSNPVKENIQRQAMNFAGYMGSGQLPGIGLMRDVSRLTGISQQSYYQDGDATAADKRLGDSHLWEKPEQFLKDLAHGTLGLTNAIPGVRKETDWLGSKINLPFGLRYIDAMKHRFFPQLWPEDKVYAELDAQNMLNPPAALMNRELDGIALSDNLQDEYNTVYNSSKGQSIVGKFSVLGVSSNITASLPYRMNLPDGTSFDRSTKMVSIPVAPMLEKHVQGKTVIEAMRSLFNDPVYQALQKLPGTTSDLSVTDQTPGERRGKPGQVLISGIKRYYAALAHEGLMRSNSPDAVEWRNTRAAAFQQRQERASSQLEDLVEALGGR